MPDVNSRFRLRADTSTAWASLNPILAAAEPGWETDTKRLRFGDGVTPFTSLPFIKLQSIDYQIVTPVLAALSALTPTADRLPYFTGASTAALTPLTAAGRALLDDADAAAQRTTLGLGSAIQDGVASVTNANSALTTGWYTLLAPYTNGPTAAAYRIHVIAADASSLHQIALLSSASTDTIWYRQRAAGTWRPWQQLAERTWVTDQIAAWPYDSGELTITTGGGHTLTHGLGGTPGRVNVTMINKTAAAGYAVNDVLDMSATGFQHTSNLGIQIWRSATQVGLIVGNNGIMILHKTTGAQVGITNSHWRLRVRAAP